MTIERLETDRLLLRKPRPEDGESIYLRYASDPDVTRLVGWPRHLSLEDTRAFIAYSDAEWQRWAVGPYLIELRASGQLLGSTGLALETRFRAATGYVLAKDAWGFGYATEALGRVVELARAVGVRRLYALCHPENAASVRVLDKCGFAREALLLYHSEFPNLHPGEAGDVLCYVRLFGEPRGRRRG
jgi:RimJ/RimL family protein N-acetyltransferase